MRDQYLKIPEQYFDLIGDHILEDGEIVQVTLLTVNILAKITQTEKCLMTNSQIASFFHCSSRSVSRAIGILMKLKLISSTEEFIEHEYCKIPVPIRVLKKTIPNKGED